MKQTIEDLRSQWAQGDAIRDAGLTPPEDLQLWKDLPYGKGQLLDVYHPMGSALPLPTIISIHGGAWCYGDKELYSNYCMHLARQGFAVVNFNYRLAPEHKYPAALEDCVAVLHWVCSQGSQYGIDPQRLFLVGDSAGGQLALQALTMLTNPAYSALFSFSCPEGLQILGCGLNCGCYWLPFSRFFPPRAMGMIFDSYFPRDYVPLLPQLKPQKYLTAQFPPAFVMSAEQDYLRFMAPMLHKQLTKAGARSVLRIYGSRDRKDIGHVFHLDCRSQEAHRCNTEQCDFFRLLLQQEATPGEKG